MRVALILLLLLAIAAIPGSVLPQWPQSATDTQAFINDNSFWGPLLDSLGFLDVFGSAWFTAIYLLLFASLIGCIIPRVAVYWREPARRGAAHPQPSRPLRARERVQPLSPADAVAAARTELTGRGPAPWRWLVGHRVRVDERTEADGTAVLALSAHRGHLREPRQPHFSPVARGHPAVRRGRFAPHVSRPGPHRRGWRASPTRSWRMTRTRRGRCSARMTSSRGF
nr:cytochrome c biogenesis protein ResB [Demequina litorisediminis]